MKSHQYLAIGFRLLAIVIFLYALRQVATFFGVAFGDTNDDMLVSPTFFLALAVIPFVAATILWVFPATIAKIIVPPDSEVAVVPEKSFSILVALVLTIGLYTFLNASLEAMYWVTHFYIVFSMDSYEQVSASLRINIAKMISTGFEFVAALLIIFRAKYIAGFLYRVAK